jgi:hypothetical protein
MHIIKHETMAAFWVVEVPLHAFLIPSLDVSGQLQPPPTLTPDEEGDTHIQCKAGRQRLRAGLRNF